MSLAHAQDGSLPDFDADEVSPYRRRQKAVPVRSRRFARLRRVLRWLLFTTFVLLPVAYAAYHLAESVLTSRLFVLNSADDVAVEGNRYVSKEQIAEALGISSGLGRAKRRTRVNMLRLSLDKATGEVESIPWVRSARLTRAYPHHLTVRVEEREPVAFVNVEGRLKLIDREGVLLERPEKATFDFPVLAGLDSRLSPPERRSRLGLYREFMQQISSEAAPSGWVVSEVDLSDSDDLKAVVVRDNKNLELHLGHDEFGARFHNFLALLPALVQGEVSAASVDLRYGNQIVVNPQPAAAGEARVAGSPPGLKAQKE